MPSYSSQSLTYLGTSKAGADPLNRVPIPEKCAAALNAYREMCPVQCSEKPIKRDSRRRCDSYVKNCDGCIGEITPAGVTLFNESIHPAMHVYALMCTAMGSRTFKTDASHVLSAERYAAMI